MGRSFVNRIEEMKCLRKVLKYDGQESPVLVFTGIGGMGKTALRAAFEKYVLKPKKVPYALLDYDGDPNLRPIEATLRAIRRQLGRHKVKTPVFDFLYARYFELSTGFKISPKNCPPELEDVATILDGIPVVGNVTQILFGLSQLGLTVKERVQHKKWLYCIRDLEPREILNLLPEVLAEDLEEAMTAQTPKNLKTIGFRITFLFDAYERISESQIDDTLHRRFLLLTPHLLRVIFTRDKLPWEHKFAKEWKNKITHSPPLDDLSCEDTRLFLAKKNVDRPELQEHLFQLTRGYPLHLELCADICREIEEITKREPEIQDFEGAAQAKDLTEELVNRLLRQLKDNERDLIGLAAYPRWVSEDVLEKISSVPESVSRIFKKFKRLSMFSAHPEIPEAYVIRKEIRDCLLLQERQKRLWERRHKKLAQFHKQCWEKTQKFYHLQESLYHGFYENPEKAMKLFEEHFWKLLEKFSFCNAEGLLESVPVEVLNEKQKRKIDYARARLLTSSVHSQQSLITAKNIYESLVEAEIDEENLAQYLLHLGELLRQYMGEFEKALEYFQKALSIYLKAFGEEHPEVAHSYNNIGGVCYDLGNYEKALEYYQKSLAIRLKVFGEEHPDVALSYNNIGAIYYHLGNYEKASEYFQKSLAIRLKVLGEEHPDVAHSYNDIGAVYHHLGNFEKALEYHQKSLAIRLKVFGEEHPQVALSYNNIGIVYNLLGNYEKASEYFQKSLAIRLKVLGEEHPQVAHSYNNIGIVYNLLGNYEKASEYHQKSLAIRLKVFGDEHPQVAHCYRNIGGVYADLGNYEKALEYQQKSLAIRLKVLGEEHPDVAYSYDSIGVVCRYLGNYEKALEYHQKSLAILLKVLGEEHPDVAYSYDSIGVVCRYLGNYEKAMEYHQKSLAILFKVLGEEHPDVADSYKEVACTLWAMKNEEEAVKKMRKSVEIFRKFNRWKDAIECLDTLAGWLEEKGKEKEAEEARKEAVRLRREHGVHCKDKG